MNPTKMSKRLIFKKLHPQRTTIENKEQSPQETLNKSKTTKNKKLRQIMLNNYSATKRRFYGNLFKRIGKKNWNGIIG